MKFGYAITFADPFISMSAKSSSNL
jgi:hypothetical protein